MALDQLQRGPPVQPSPSSSALQLKGTPAGALQVACIGDNNGAGLPVETSAGELTLLRHRCLDAEQRLEAEEQRCVEAVRQMESAKQRALEAQKYADEARRRVLALEVRNEDNERSLSDAKRACERQEQRAELAERAVRGLELQVVDADRRAKQAELLCCNAEQRVRETESRSGEAGRLAKGEALRAADAEARMKAAEAHQATAERRAADAEARLRESERRLRDVDRQLSELSCKWRDSDRQRQSLDAVLSNAETVARQARTECDAELQHMQQVAESWREAMSRDLDELRLALEQALTQKGAAELRAAELEAEVGRQARLTSRSESEEVVRSMLESRLRTCEQSLAARDCTIAQLQAAVSAAHEESCQAMQSLSCELEAKSLALADAEMRFTELEALMQRIIGRTSALHDHSYYC
uniref:Uncharacterized protein n=1 Tax=Dunaliella tertiolecta TaxID=3047 RepID=A0A7S3R0B0_DUNTE